MTALATTETTSEAIIHSLLEKIKTIELELTTLKGGVFQLAKQEGVHVHTFADLKGAFPEFGNLTEEEIDAVIYREPPFMDDFPEMAK
ncbi:MAG: hypothetical protein ACRD82_12915 [Blastocatellia bacterium]